MFVLCTQARLEIRNIHSAAHGQLVNAGTPPSGFDATSNVPETC